MDEMQFKNPPAQYRPVSFWSWNDRLDNQVLKEQIHAMAQQGWGGFFMHARGGLETAYLSDEWMDSVRNCVREAKKLGCAAWLYDEDTWPSGTAGCTVPRLKKDYRETHLFVARGEIPHHPDDVKIFRVYRARKEYGVKAGYYRVNSLDYTLKDFTEIPLEEAEKDRENAVVLYFYQWTAPLTNGRFRGASYVDLMNPEATRAFIEATHEKYKTACGEEFGDTVPGIFTDDLTVVWNILGMKKDALPWTEKMPEIFKDRYGYDLLDFLPHLFYRLEGYEKVRYDYYRLVNRLFAENYTKVIYDWCGRNRLKSTGHLMGDGRGYIDFAQHYEYMQYPGTDHLGFECDDFVDHRLAQSVADQLGRERTVCEAFAATGQNFTFEEQKWVSDWLFINGVSLLTIHISAYGMRGERKRDCPPAISWQQPWWEYNHLIAGYQSRLCYALSQGSRITDLLVIHPAESVGMAYSPLNPQKADKITGDYVKCLHLLMENNFDFELGSEELMGKHGEVKDGKLFIGKAGYSAVLIPEVLTLRASTRGLLSQFSEAGGRVLVLGKMPERTDGVLLPGQGKPLPGLKQMVSYKLIQDLERTIQKTFDVRLEDGSPASQILRHARNIPDGILCFLANHDLDHAYAARVSIKGCWNVTALNLLNGEEHALDVKTDEQKTEFIYAFAPCGSVLLKLRKRKKDETGSPYAAKAASEQILALHGEWKAKLLERNVLVLDRCSYSVENMPFSKEEYFLKVQQALSERKSAFTVRYRFGAAAWNGQSGFLVLEEPHRFTIRVNGKPISYADCGYWKDAAFKKIPLDGLIREGENTVELSAEWNDGIHNEAVFITGGFDVKPVSFSEFAIAPVGARKFKENLTEEGCPFYAGNVELTTEVELDKLPGTRYLLRFKEMDAVMAEIFVNGESCGPILWKPYQADITRYLRQGSNVLTLRLVNSLHNLLGPHHADWIEKKRWVPPARFVDYENWSESYYLRPFGVKSVSIEIHPEEQEKHPAASGRG